MSLCDACAIQADRQAEQMKPRDVREGLALVAHADPFLAVADKPLPDIRMGDIVRVQLVAGAVEDMPWCNDEDCDNGRRAA